ncbi:MAG: hypothetical protein HYZ89_05805 [Candidatus Omnitrophica bacterium]|nr:hypothetical protein [Candidatus Omnitrophota bacterium]
MSYFIEHLTLRNWFRVVLPLLVRRKRLGRGAERCYVFDGSRPGMAVARAMRWLTSIPVQHLDIRLLDVRDEHGLLIRSKIHSSDLLKVQADVTADPRFREGIHASADEPRLFTYVAKALVDQALSDRHTLWRALLIVQICAWKVRTAHPTETSVVCLMERRPWMEAVIRYAARSRVTVLPVNTPFRIRGWVRRYLSPMLIECLRDLRSRWMSRGLGESEPLRRPSPRRIAVDYYGHFNLNRPDCYSELFFWQQSSIPAREILMLFGVMYDPLDREKWTALTRAGFDAVALEPEATTTSGLPTFFRHQRSRGAPRTSWRLSARGTAEAGWLARQVREYETQRAYWSELVARYQVRVFLSWYKLTQTHCAIADALEERGGVTAMYQRSYEPHPSAEGRVTADILFGFSKMTAEVERRSGSVIPYCVTTGYLGDHRFPLLRKPAQDLRDRLHRQGATRILAFSDENSHDEARWSLGHVVTRENYAFLLEKVLSEPWLGLVIKPKVPGTLRKRLGPVAPLLERAEATGRCVVCEGQAMRGSYPPALAALASDVMIHGHLLAGTAGIESALAGVPTLFMDREGSPSSPLYRLGLGRVVFTDWERLWKTCLEHWNHPGTVPGFGDWSLMLDELDPFRDGRAAQRMGTYLQWLLDGFQAGRHRDTVMADAAERYAERWGKDKILQVNPALSGKGGVNISRREERRMPPGADAFLVAAEETALS